MPLLNIAKETITENFSMPCPHSHTHFELYFLVKGTRLFFIDESSFEIEKNTLIVIPPLSKHMTSGGPFERYTINVFPQFLTEFQTTIINTLLHQTTNISDATMKHLITCLENLITLNENDEYYDEHAFSIFSYVIFLIFKEIKTYPFANTKLDKQNSPVPLLIFKISNFINDNLHEKLSLDYIAQQFLISTSYLRKQFQTYMHHSLYDYIINLRIKKAKDYLITTKFSTVKIAELCGFSSANYFSLIFKRKEGIPPLTYRKSTKSNKI